MTRELELNVPDWQLERYLLDELPAREYRAVREALERDFGLRLRLAALERSNQEILSRHPPRVAAAAIRARAFASSMPRGKRRWGTSFRRPALAAALSLAATAASIVFFVPRWHDHESAADVTRIKGLEPHLVLYRKGAGAEAEPLAPDATARAGDVIQIAYQAAGRRYGVVVSIDGRGLVTRHLPVAGTEAAELSTGLSRPLAEAYELDDAPDFERFYFVAASEPFPVETVLSAVQRTRATSESQEARLDLPSSFDEFSYVLRKEPSQ